MRKKIVAILLSIVTCFGLMTGCALFEYDSERDYSQAAVTVASYDITETYSDGKTKTYTADEKKIYKYELVSYYNQVASTLINNYKYTPAQVVEYVLSQLVQQTIVLNEVNAQIYFGNIVLGVHDENEIKKNVYSAIDSQLFSLKNEILSSRGETTSSQGDSSDSSEKTETTYPVKEEKTVGEYDDYTREELIAEALSDGRSIVKAGDEKAVQKLNEFTKNKLVYLLEKDDLNKEDVWEPAKITYPGVYGTEDNKSLEREAVRRFLTFLRTTVTNDYRVDETERAKCLTDLDRLDAIADEKGITAVYPELYKGNPDDNDGKGAVIEYFIGSSYRNNAKIDLLRDYITYNVDVTDEEVAAKYDELLAGQKANFNADSSALSKAISNKETVVYYPANTDIYFVKHILVPFTETQKSLLTARLKENSLYTEEQKAAIKKEFGNSITGYVHEGGENSGNPLTLAEIYADVKRTMSAASGSLCDKERAFEDLIFKYNTDTGIFNNELGYSVKVTTGDKYDEQYMREFSLAAKSLYEAGVVGAISEPAITDYGAHIVYLAQVIPSSGKTLGLNDYLTYGRYTKVSEKIESDLRTEKTNNYFSEWQQTKIGNYLNTDKVITYNDKVYSDLTKA